MMSHGWLARLTMACLAVAMLVAPTALAQSGPSPEFPISLVCGQAYWASYDDYLEGKLTVPYQISNTGGVTGYNVTIETATATNGVINSTFVPVWLGDMGPGDWNLVPFVWDVPSGVTRFRSTLKICSDCNPSICVGEQVADDFGVVDETNNGGINIKPNSCPNSIKLTGAGNIAVAVYSYGEFDAQTLDDDTVIFAGASPVSWATEDVDEDGTLDVVYHFDKGDVDLTEGDIRACLSAEITGGGIYRSCDMVRVL